VNVPVGEVRLKTVERFGPADGRRLDAFQPEHLGNPGHQLIQVGAGGQRTELMPWPEGCRNGVRRKRIDEGQPNPPIVSFFVVQVLPEESRFGRRAASYAAFGGTTVSRKPALGRYHQHAGRLIRPIFAPLRPTFVRPALMLVQKELVQFDREARLPQQFAEPAYGPRMIGTFPAIADENVLKYGHGQSAAILCRLFISPGRYCNPKGSLMLPQTVAEITSRFSDAAITVNGARFTGLSRVSD
jgi:hypothetical protein